MTRAKIIKALQYIIDYPAQDDTRRDEDGYPAEVCYDEFSYKRMVDSYRDGLRGLIKDIEK